MPKPNKARQEAKQAAIDADKLVSLEVRADQIKAGSIPRLTLPAGYIKALSEQYPGLEKKEN